MQTIRRCSYFMPAPRKRFRSRGTYRGKAPRTMVVRSIGCCSRLLVCTERSYEKENPGTHYCPLGNNLLMLSIFGRRKTSRLLVNVVDVQLIAISADVASAWRPMKIYRFLRSRKMFQGYPCSLTFPRTVVCVVITIDTEKRQ